MYITTPKVCKESKRLRNLEKELESCQRVLEGKFGVVGIRMPFIEKQQVFYPGLEVEIPTKKVNRLRRVIFSKISSNTAVPGTVVINNSDFEDHDRENSYYVIEIQPYLARTVDEVLENSSVIANHLYSVLKNYMMKK